MILFSKKEHKNTIPVTLDLCDDCFILNGKQFQLTLNDGEEFKYFD